MNPTPLMNSSIEKGRPSKHQYGTMMSRNSSREASIDPMSQRRVDGRGTIPGEDRSESEVDKSPHKAVGTRQPSQFGIGPKRGKNIIDNLGDETNHQHEIKRWNTYGARGDQSENLDQSNNASNTTVVNHSSIPRAQKMSNFAGIKEPGQSRTDMVKNFRNRNFTCDVDRNHIVENDESEKSFDDAKAPFKRAGTVKRLTHIVSKNSQEEYKVKYLKLPVTANGSYALVEKWRLRQEDQLEFAMKFMTVTKVSDKIKSSLCLSDAEARDMAIKLCENELNVSKTLGPHPNIASIEDSYVDKAKGEYRFFSKWADLSTLLSDSHQQWLKQAQSEDLNNQEQEIMKNYFVDIVKGLQHMHQKKIVHRDLKPENILIFGDGTAKLTDFSVSLLVEQPETDLLKLGTTKICQPPEVWKDPNYIGYPHDIWSLGYILWFILFKTSPFKSTNEQLLKQEVINFELDFSGKALDDSLKKLLRGMLDTNESKRWNISQVAGCQWLA